MQGETTIWIEKYRPMRLEDVVGQQNIIARLKNYVRTKNLPHLLFTGPAGIGKTTSAVALAREFFGENWHMNFRELNASDERGIDVVRNQIKQFARTAPLGDSSFKILFLDEADALTSDAQAALRRTMENYAQNCRFVLSCNYSSKIIDPIQSRCAIYRFKPLDNEAIAEEIQRIAEAEQLTITADARDALIYIAQGDMRRAINALQGAAIIGPEIDATRIYEITSNARPEEIGDLVQTILSGDFDGAEYQLHELMHRRGISPDELISQWYRVLVAHEMDRKLKAEMIGYLGDTDFRLSEGAHAEIQMEALIAKCILAAERQV